MNELVVRIDNLLFLEDVARAQSLKHFAESVDELAKSIAKEGLLKKVLVVKDEEPDKYLVIDGMRRVLACEKLGMQEIACELADVKSGEEAKVWVRANRKNN